MLRFQPVDGLEVVVRGHLSVYAPRGVYQVNASAMEPHAALAEWEGETLTLRGAQQMLKTNRLELADAVGIDPENVRILSPYIGGGFGSKLGIGPEAVSAALAARELRRPVRVVMARQTVFVTPPSTSRIKGLSSIVLSSCLNACEVIATGAVHEASLVTDLAPWSIEWTRLDQGAAVVPGFDPYDDSIRQ